MTGQDFFDVLSISDENGNVDMIQALMGNDCLGTYFNNGIAKLYFYSGLKNDLEARLQEINSNHSFQWKWEKQNKENWHLTWQDNFQPVIIEGKLAVIPHWQDDSPEDIVIKIKPGMAFGTGHHETTWLILSQMMKHIKPGMSALDLGTGSGILSIAAIKLGALKVDAVENDPDCETNFKENLNLNHMDNNIHYYHRDVLTWNKLDYNIILANINRNVIEDLIPIFQTSKGTILLSGLLAEDYDAIEKLCQKHHLQVKEKITKGEWICIKILSN